MRVGFGVIWGVDAVLKWLPGFRASLVTHLQAAGAGQPGWLDGWFSVWVRVVRWSPGTVAVLLALGETAICVSLLFGIAQRVSFGFGTGLALLIWATGEGFGGPYVDGSSDIGAAVIYVVVFSALWFAVPRSVRAAAPALDNRFSRWRPWRRVTF